MHLRAHSLITENSRALRICPCLFFAGKSAKMQNVAASVFVHSTCLSTTSSMVILRILDKSTYVKMRLL